MIVAICAVTKGRVTLQAIAVADAVTLAAVVLLAVAALPGSFLDVLLLHRASLFSLLCIVILASDALTDTWNASYAVLKADTVQLAAFTALAVAVLSCGIHALHCRGLSRVVLVHNQMFSIRNQTCGLPLLC